MIETVLPVEMEVALESGATETVKLRQIKVREFRSAQSVAIGDEAKLIEICADKPAGWADTLTPDGFNVVAIEARRINAAFFAWSERVLADQMRQMPPTLLEKVLNQATAGLSPSNPGSPKLRPRREPLT